MISTAERHVVSHFLFRFALPGKSISTIFLNINHNPIQITKIIFFRLFKWVFKNIDKIAIKDTPWPSSIKIE
jgi:hypothetical protein